MGGSSRVGVGCEILSNIWILDRCGLCFFWYEIGGTTAWILDDLHIYESTAHPLQSQVAVKYLACLMSIIHVQYCTYSSDQVFTGCDACPTMFRNLSVQ